MGEISTRERRRATRQRFARLLKRAQAAYPDLRVSFGWNRAAGDGARRAVSAICDPGCQALRAFAWCLRDRTGALRVEAAPRLALQSAGRQEGVLRHELGHAILLDTRGIGDAHTERDADAAAERVFKRPLFYDQDLVQTIDRGQRPRPAGLDTPPGK